MPLSNPAVTEWMGKLLWMTALCGGVFGLLGGWLIDRLGRKFVMALGIFVYSFSPVAGAFATLSDAFVFWRCATFVGVCIEFVAAITWIAEVFSDKAQKERWLGITQAFASLGGVLVTAINVWIVAHAKDLPHLACRWRSARRTRLVALSLLTGIAARHPDRAHAALRAGIENLAGAEAGRHAEAPELRRALFAGVAPRDAGHRGAFRLRLRRRLRRAAAHPWPHRPRPAGSGASSARL